MWGNWVYDAKHLTLTYRPTRYEIDLERLDTCAAMLDTIFQIGMKGWGAKNVSDLIHALDYLMQPQATLCSFKCDLGPINPSAVIKKRTSYV